MPVALNGNHSPLSSSLTDEDQKILKDMCSPDSETTFIFDPKSSPDKILRSLYVVTRATSWLEKRHDGLVQVIGRILHVIKNNPHIYTDMGYRSWDQFLKGHVVGALECSPTTLKNSVSIYEAFPTVAASDVAEVGITKMLRLSRHTNSTQPGHVALIEAAKSQTYRQLVVSICEKEHTSPDEEDRAVLVIQLTKAQKQMFAGFADDARVQSHCGTKDWGLILEYMVAELMGDWLGEDVAV